MIRDHDRSEWFGASDTATIMGSWGTKTFRRFWLQKLGLNRDHFTNLEMETGHGIRTPHPATIGIKRMDPDRFGSTVSGSG